MAVWLTPGAWLVELRLLMTPPASENVTPSIQPALRGPFRFPLWAGEPKQPPQPPESVKYRDWYLNACNGSLRMQL